MILRPATSQPPEPRTITLADGQTLTLVISRPNFQQRFNDEGRELKAYAGGDPDAWSNFRLGRIRDAVVDWQNVTNEKDQPIPFTFGRLMGLFEVAPEVVAQVVAIANEAFRPLVLPSLKSDAPPVTSGAPDPATSESAANSASTASSDGSEGSPSQLESPPGN